MEPVTTGERRSGFEIAEALSRRWGVFLVLGLLLVLLGGYAVSAAATTSLVSVIFFGSLLLVAGAAELVRAFRDRQSGGFTLHLLSGLLSIVVGVMILRTPVAGALSLTLLAAGFLMASGIFRIVASLSQRHIGWGWEAFNGVVSLVLGVMIWAQWPVSGLWTIGLFVGLELVFRGATWISFAFLVRGARRALAT